ncbi:MAG: hypothetical protein Q9185_002535 [Variospora sp. 1 TL-2023]
MLLRRELAVTSSRAPLYSTIINLSPFHDTDTESTHALHRITETNRRKYTRELWRGDRHVAAYEAWHRPRPPPDLAPGALLPNDVERRSSTPGGTPKSGIEQSSINDSRSSGAWKAPVAVQTSLARSSPECSTATFINHVSSKRQLRKPELIVISNTLPFHHGLLEDYCADFKRLIENAATSHSSGSFTETLLYDLRDELFFFFLNVTTSLRQTWAFYDRWELGRSSIPAFREKNLLVPEPNRRKELRDITFSAVWREVCDLRNLIRLYTSLVDRYYRRRNMPDKVDGVFARADPLYLGFDVVGNRSLGLPPALAAHRLEMLKGVAATKCILLVIYRCLSDLGRYKDLLAPYAQQFILCAKYFIELLHEIASLFIRPSTAERRRTAAGNMSDGALQSSQSSSIPRLQQDGLSMFFPARDNRETSSNPVKGELPTVRPIASHPEVSAASKVISHAPGISMPDSTASLASAASDLGMSVLSNQSYRLSSQLSMKGDPSQLWPDHHILRKHSYAVLRSICELVDILRLPTSQDNENVYMNQFLLYAVEFHHSKNDFGATCHDARMCTRLREEWEGAVHASGTCSDSPRLEIRQRFHGASQAQAGKAFRESVNHVYSSYIEFQQCQTLYGLSAKRRLKKVYYGIVSPWLESGRQLHKGFRYGDEPLYFLNQFHTSNNAIKRIPNELVHPWMGHSTVAAIIFKRVMVEPLRKFLQSFNILHAVLSQLRINLFAEKHILSFGALRFWLIGPQSHDMLGAGAGAGSPQHRSLLKPHSEHEANHGFRNGLPKLRLRNVTSASKPRVAAFHASAATRRPLVTADLAPENEQPLQEQMDQAIRSNGANDAQIGTLIGYRIPEARMRECLHAEAAYWQYTLYEGPKGEKVKVHYCRSLETSERIAKLFLNESAIGFDIEWKPQATAKEGIRKNVAVIQLASEDRIAIFHLARFSKGDSMDELVVPSFKRIMESASITKVGVSIKSDCTRVRKFLDVRSRGLFELSHLYKLVQYAANDVKKINKMLVSLATQTEQHLLLPMYKDESVRSSDWSEELDYKQIYYAASDSYAGFQLYHTLNRKRLALIPPPPLPAHADLNLPIRLANGQTVAEYEDPSAEEPLLEPSSSSSSAVGAPLSPIDKLAKDVMNLQIEDATEEQPSSPPIRPSPAKPKPQYLPLSSHPSFLAANDWVARYRASHPHPLPTTSSNAREITTDLSYPLLLSPSPSPSPNNTNRLPRPRTRATPSLLRAYFLFHHHALSIPDIAALLRAPPFPHATVAGHVLEAARLEGLPLEKGRVQELERAVGDGGYIGG